MAETKRKSDDPFDDDWGLPGTEAESDELPPPTVDPNRLPFLKPSHLRDREGRFELVGASGSTRYSDVVLHVKVNGRMFGIGLRTFDPAYSALVKKFGTKKTDWHGTLRYKIMPHGGKSDGFVAVRPA